MQHNILLIILLSFPNNCKLAESDTKQFQPPWTSTYIGITHISTNDDALTSSDGIYTSDTLEQMPGFSETNISHHIESAHIYANNVRCGDIEDIENFDMSKEGHKLCNFVIRAPNNGRYVERLGMTILEIKVLIPNEHVNRKDENTPPPFTEKIIYAKFVYTKPATDDKISAIKNYGFEDINSLNYDADKGVYKKPRIFVDQRFVGLCDKWCFKRDNQMLKFGGNGPRSAKRFVHRGNENIVLCYEASMADCDTDTVIPGFSKYYFFHFGDTAANIRGTDVSFSECAASGYFGATKGDNCPLILKKLSLNAFKAKFRKHKSSQLYTVFTNFTYPARIWGDITDSHVYSSYIRKHEPNNYRAPVVCKDVPLISIRQRMGFAGTRADISRSVPILFRGDKNDKEQMKEMCGACVIITLIAPTNYPFGHKTVPAEFKFYGHFYDPIEPNDLTEDMKDASVGYDGSSETIDAVGLNIDFIIPFEQLANAINNECAQNCYGKGDRIIAEHGTMKLNEIIYCDQLGTTKCGYMMDSVVPRIPGDVIYESKKPGWNQALSSFALFGESTNNPDPNIAWSKWWKEGWLTAIEMCDGCVGDLPPLYD